MLAQPRRRPDRSNPNPDASRVPTAPARTRGFGQDFDVCVLSRDSKCVEAAVASFFDGVACHHDPLHDAALDLGYRRRGTHRLRRLRVLPSPEVRRLWIGLDSGSGWTRPRLRSRDSGRPCLLRSCLGRP